MSEFFDLSVASFVLTVIRAATALGLLWLLLRVADRVVGFSFRDWMTRVSGQGEDARARGDGDENPMAVAVYLGARFVGACLLFGLLFS